MAEINVGILNIRTNWNGDLFKIDNFHLELLPWVTIHAFNKQDLFNELSLKTTQFSFEAATFHLSKPFILFIFSI